ncbi:MAG: glycosyltransferase family 2 protein [Candidatus Jordarchaeum sp.]|uniref:glycosyltransferase family 2 protein n=1 Tax=Candidatus Jordarchaeum sp. TaxID=2823881 RepID=UPI004049E23F
MAKVLCVSPAYNEEKTVFKIVKGALKYTNGVIVVDDGSTDSTHKEAEKAGATVIRHNKNRGKGVALKTGFKSALEMDAETVIVLDADGQHNPEEIPKLLKTMNYKNSDIIIGSRFLGDIKGMPRIRILSNTLTTMVLRLFFGLPITDSQSGFRAYKRRVLEKVEFSAPRFSAETEILIDAKRKGFKILETRVQTVYGEEKSKMRNFEDTIRWIWGIDKQLIKTIRNKLST